MSKFSICCYLWASITVNVYCIFGWVMAEGVSKAWQQFAIAEDTVIIQQHEALKRTQESIDWCFERPINMEINR